MCEINVDTFELVETIWATSVRIRRGVVYAPIKLLSMAMQQTKIILHAREQGHCEFINEVMLCIISFCMKRICAITGCRDAR